MKGKYPVVIKDGVIGELILEIRLPASVQMALSAVGIDKEAQDNLIGQYYNEIVSALSGYLDGDFDL